LVVDTVRPVVAVNALTTASNRPTLTGTVSDPSPSGGIAGVSVVVGSQTLAATISGGTWSVIVPASLSDGTYNVQATATDRAGNSTTDSTANELIVDTVVPVVTVNAVVADTNPQNLNLTGTVSDPSPGSGIAGVTVVVAGQTLTATVTGGNRSV